LAAGKRNNHSGSRLHTGNSCTGDQGQEKVIGDPRALRNRLQIGFIFTYSQENIRRGTDEILVPTFVCRDLKSTGSTWGVNWTRCESFRCWLFRWEQI